MIVTIIHLQKYYTFRTLCWFYAQKAEYVNHAQKRLGTRQEKHMKEKKSTIFSSGRKIRSKNLLTEEMIYKMENYYVIAIWQNYIDNESNNEITWSKIFDCINIYKYHKL